MYFSKRLSFHTNEPKTVQETTTYPEKGIYVLCKLLLLFLLREIDILLFKSVIFCLYKYRLLILVPQNFCSTFDP